MPFIERLRIQLRWPFYVGSVFILVAIALEHGFDVFGVLPTVPVSMIYTKKTIILLIAEIGYAFIIAWIVAEALEANAKAEHLKEVKEARELIAKDVTHAIFGIRHDPQYVRAVLETCFEQPHFREDYDLQYRIDSFPAKEAAKLGIEPSRFVLMSTRMRYRVRNMGAKEEKFRIGYGLPMRSGQLEKFSKITAITTGSKTYSASEISEMEVPHNGENVPLNDKAYEFYVTVAGGGSIDVLIESQTVKELSDNDTFGFRFPTTNARLRMDVNIDELKFGVTARVAANLVEIIPPTDRSGEWKIDGPILPYNSVVFWWRTPQDDGQEKEATPESVKDNVNLKAVRKRPRLAKPNNHINGGD